MKKLISVSILFLAALASSLQAGVVVVGKLAHHSTIKPGDAIEGVITLKNPDSQPAEARVFQTDFLSTANVAADCGEPGINPRSNASWITVSPSRVKLAAGETISVRYKGRAPSDVKLRGTYWSIIMIEPITADATRPDGQGKQAAVGLKAVIRYGVQVVTELGRDGKRSLQMTGKSLVKEEGKRSLLLDVANDGEHLLIPAVGLELFDGNGVSLGRFEAGRTRIYPTCSTRSRIDLTKVPAGKYTAMVLLDSGGDQVMGAQYDLAIEP